MDGSQPEAKELIGHDQMTQIGAGELLTGAASATFLHRSRVESMPGIADVESSLVSEQGSISCDPGREDAVESVDSSGHGYEYIFRRSHSQEMPGSIFRSSCRAPTRRSD